MLSDLASLPALYFIDSHILGTTVVFSSHAQIQQLTVQIPGNAHACVH
jgi:hypothetical protein